MKTAYNNWVKAGSSNTFVDLLAEVKNTKRAYKKAMKEAKYKRKLKNGRKLEQVLNSCNSKNFWKLWNCFYKNDDVCSDCIDGESNEQIICEKFAKVFQKNFTNSDDNVYLREQFFNVCNSMSNVKDNNEVILKLDDVVNAIGKMNLS